MDRELVRDLCNAFGPSGFEDEVVQVLARHGQGLSLKSDAMYNMFARGQKEKPHCPTILLDAHTDEVGFMVKSITANGLLRLAPLGGWVGTNVLAHTLWVRNSSGQKFRGIVVSKPPHFMKEEERKVVPLVQEMMMDIGAMSKERAQKEFGIQIGDPCAPDVEFDCREDGLLFGKAFDNRLGCACILETMGRLKDEDLSLNLVGAFASQEEVGMRGAKVTGSIIKPDLAIVFEGSPADDLYDEVDQSQCVLGKGVQIRCKDASYLSSPSFLRLAKNLAEGKNIPYQLAVRHQGSTNAGEIHTAHKGVPVLVLGVPSRFVHTHYNYAMEQDVNAAVDLAVEVIRELNRGKINEILCPMGF